MLLRIKVMFQFYKKITLGLLLILGYSAYSDEIVSVDPDTLYIYSNGCLVKKDNTVECEITVYGVANRFPAFCEADLEWYNPKPEYFYTFHRSYENTTIENGHSNKIVFPEKSNLHQFCLNAVNQRVSFACITNSLEGPMGFGMYDLNQNINCE